MPRKKSTKPLVVKPEEITPIPSLPEPPQRNPNLVKNIIKGTTLHLGDGRRLKFGEEAEVGPDVAEFLRERGQAE